MISVRKILSSILEELLDFVKWAMPTLWNMFAKSEPKEELKVTGVIETEDGTILTTYSDGTIDSGPPATKGSMF